MTAHLVPAGFDFPLAPAKWGRGQGEGVSKRKRRCRKRPGEAASDLGPRRSEIRHANGVWLRRGTTMGSFKDVATGPLVAACTFLSAPSAAADAVIYEISDDLYKACGAKSSEPLCAAFITAVLEIMANTELYGYKACIPRRTNVAPIIDLTISWISAHPNDFEHPASWSVARAIAEAFPCRRPQDGSK